MSWVITGSQKEPAGDPFFFSNVSLLLHGDGPNGSTLIRDSSSRMNTVTAVGNVQISTAQSKFGGASILFDGTNDRLDIANNTAFGFGTGDFTLECWIRTTTKNTVIFDNRFPLGSTVPGVFFIAAPTGRLSYFDSSVGSLAGTTTDCATGQWVHVAFARASGTFRMFANGALEYSGSLASDFGSSRTLRIGEDQGGAADYNGYMDDIRITKGVARYTANFTPPTAPFPDI
jgi:hypothetical protein